MVSLRGVLDQGKL